MFLKMATFMKEPSSITNFKGKGHTLLEIVFTRVPSWLEYVKDRDGFNFLAA